MPQICLDGKNSVLKSIIFINLEKYLKINR